MQDTQRDTKTSSATPGSHERLEGKHAIPLPTPRAFGLTFFGVFALVAGVAAAFGKSWWPWPAGFAAVVLALALAAPQWLAGANRGWFRVGMAIHAVVSQVVLLLLFVVAMMPIGLLMRLVGRDALRLRPSRDGDTYWVRREAANDPRTVPQAMRDQF